MNKVFPAIVLSAFLLKASIVSAGIKQLKDTGDGFNAESEEVEANLSQVIGEAYSLKDKIHTVIEEIRLIQARDSGKTPQERMSIQDLVDYSEQLQDLIVTLSQKAADLLEVQDQVVAMRQKIVLKELSLNLKEKQVHSSDTEVFDLEEKKILISRLEREKEELLQKMSGLYQENQKIIQQMQEWKEAGTEAADDSQQQLTELKEKWQSESAEIEKNLHSLQEENRRLTAQLQESNKQRLQLTQSVEKYQKNAEDVNSRTKTLSQTNEQLEDRIVQLTDKADAVELLLSQKEQEMTLLTNNLAQLKQELEDKNLVITKWESGEMQNFQNVEKQVEEAKRPLEDKIDSLKEEIQQILVDADRKVQEAMQPLQKRYEDLEKEMVIKEETYAKALREVQHPLQERVIALEKQIQDYKESLDKKNTDIATGREKEQSLEKGISELKDKNKNLSKEIAQLEKTIKNNTKIIDEKNKQIASQDERLQTQSNDVALLEKINKDLKKERELLVEKSDDLESQVQANAAVLQNMEAMTEEKKELLTKLSLLEKANNDMNAQIASLEQELNEGKNQADTQEARTALSLKNLAQLQEEISKALDVLSAHE